MAHCNSEGNGLDDGVEESLTSQEPKITACGGSERKKGCSR